jgi:mono/diheme cytochrome c family protein
MRKALRMVMFIVVALVLVAAIVALSAGPMSERKRARVLDIKVEPVAFVTDDAAVKRGEYLYESRGCMECHGADGAGREVINDPGGFYVKSPNISPGPGSVTRNYTEVDWVAAIRHGVTPSRHPLMIMPSKDYSRLTDTDLAAVVAYVRSMPPAVGDVAVVRMPLMVKGLYAAGAIKDDAEGIDHALPPAQPVAEAISVEHGAYVAPMCKGCHGDGLSGGPVPGGPPQWPPAANLTPGAGSVMPRYDTVDKFAAMLHTGKRPDGTAVSRVMPFATLNNLNDTDVGAVYAYLKTIPARPSGEH